MSRSYARMAAVASSNISSAITLDILIIVAITKFGCYIRVMTTHRQASYGRCRSETQG